MPVELLDNVIANGDDVFSQTVAPKGRVSVWCVHEGASADGFKSADQVIQHGLPFGHGSLKTVRGFETAMIPVKGGKPRANIVQGPMGRKYIELHVDEESMIAKQVWEGSVSNDRVKSAQGGVKRSDENDGEISATVTKATDEIKKLTDDEIDALAEKRLREITSDAP